MEATAQHPDILYQHLFPKIAAHVQRNSGDIDDARDVFQEALLVWLKKREEPGFVLTSTLETYLFAIARNCWLNKLKERQKIIPCEAFADMPEETQATPLREQLPRWLRSITQHCRQIIRSIYFLQEPMEKLAVRMGWKNRHTADNQKYKCLQQLRKASRQ
ncbi:sigma-70 family RNA polymerase sigma factor [Chitinophaga lutea]|uniref:Sigma-70 family RNA polymerase sigma factor n=1 Tax=Chitinophaga lutea TaxID=2488634 RepID=A0A3N4PUX7_9BACT|nr:sigma-70 family RNA polymerase sigma factor [Chitinophaga lutea]RPE12593.1 sigma-70 family RNA polymerase sigma factor [Chitinophaga lutea]